MKFKNAIAIRETSVNDNMFRSIGDFKQKETTDILEGLNYHFFTQLFSQGNNIDSILGRLTKEEAKLAAKNLKRYLKVAGTFTKSLQNYIDEKCFTESWLQAEELNQKINN